MNARTLTQLLVLMLLGAVVSQLLADNAEADRKTFEQIKINAENGSAKAQYALGLFYRDGFVISKDASEAVKWFKKAAELGEAEAQTALAQALRRGTGIAENIPEAIKWYRKAAEQGDSDAQLALGYAYKYGEQEQFGVTDWKGFNRIRPAKPARRKVGIAAALEA